MSDKNKLNSQEQIDKTRRGSHLTFLSPDQKLPALKTTFKRPQNVSLADLSPFYRQSVNPFLYNSSYVGTSSFLPELTSTDTGENSDTDIHVGEYKSDQSETNNETKRFENRKLFGKPSDEILKESYVKVSKAHNKQIENDDEPIKTNNVQVLKGKQSHTSFNTEALKEVDIMDIESQIIPVAERNVETAPLSLSNFKSCSASGQSSLGQNKNSEQDCSERQYTHHPNNGNHTSTTKNTVTGESRRRRYTPSFCSSCSCDDHSMTVQSRCSICDGCSSSACNSSYSSIEPSHVHSGGDCLESYYHPLEMSESKIENLLDSHLSFDELDSTLLKTLVEDVDETKETENPNKLSLSTQQLIFLLLRMVLAKYKQLTEDVATEKQISRSQRQSIACLIQAVILLSRKIKTTSEQWQTTQIQLQVIQTDHNRLRRQNRKIMAMCCFLVILNVCRISPVKNRIIKMVKLFGFVENVRKINRLRKMVAENWQNIPSLLTDFWRIFIFRSTTRLKIS